MDYEHRIPMLVIPEGSMEFNRDTYDEPIVVRCSHCGNSLFYCVNRYGLIDRSDSWINRIHIVGETEETKKYRSFDITETTEQKYCAICKKLGRNISLEDDDKIVHVFNDDYDVEEYEKALSVLKFPKLYTIEHNERYLHLANEMKQWISDYELYKKSSVIDIHENKDVQTNNKDNTGK